MAEGAPLALRLTVTPSVTLWVQYTMPYGSPSTSGSVWHWHGHLPAVKSTGHFLWCPVIHHPLLVVPSLAIAEDAARNAHADASVLVHGGAVLDALRARQDPDLRVPLAVGPFDHERVPFVDDLPADLDLRTAALVEPVAVAGKLRRSKS